MNYTEHLPPHILIEQIETVHRDRQRWISQQKKGFLRYRRPCEKLRQFTNAAVDCSGDTVLIGNREQVSESQQRDIREQLRAFMPWRKGAVFNLRYRDRCRMAERTEMAATPTASSRFKRKDNCRHWLQQRLLHVPDDSFKAAFCPRP